MLAGESKRQTDSKRYLKEDRERERDKGGQKLKEFPTESGPSKFGNSFDIYYVTSDRFLLDIFKSLNCNIVANKGTLEERLTTRYHLENIIVNLRCPHC